MAKYDPLETHLLALPRSKRFITLSFSDIETILGEPLPKSAITHRQWWENQSDTSTRSQASAWMFAGFAVDSVHQALPNPWVKFVRL